MSKTKKPRSLYVLRLSNGKYYIGLASAKNPDYRIKQHSNGYYSAQWVKLYRPFTVTEKIYLGNITLEQGEALENQRTLQYMKKYGLQNVRGGKFNYSGKYVKIGDRYWRGDQFEILLALLLLIAGSISLLLKN